jgi:hypothetical protein
MICKTCETLLPDNANFCFICRKPVVEDVHHKPQTYIELRFSYTKKP